MIATRVAKNREELLKYKVDILDENKNLKSTYQILTELAPEWEKLNSQQKVALGNTLAGTNQYKIFAAVMSQMVVPAGKELSEVQQAYQDALESSGTTMEQNAIYMQSLEA